MPVLADDTPEALEARVLEREHVMYPRAVGWLVRGELRVIDGLVTHTRGEPQLL